MLSEQVAILEEERDHLSQLVGALGEELENLRQNPPAGKLDPLKDYLIELMAPDIERLEAHAEVLGERHGEIYRTYRKLFPKEKGEGKSERD